MFWDVLESGFGSFFFLIVFHVSSKDGKEKGSLGEKRLDCLCKTSLDYV